MSEPISRRGFLSSAVAGMLAPVAVTRLVAQSAGDTAAASRAAELRDPASAGRARERTIAADNDEVVKSAELRLACSCPCTLDIYTCRTTDFTCTYSPALHREIVALRDEGLSADEIVSAFIEKYGEEALMAPRPEGFNLAGYLVPGTAITFAGGALAWFIVRRQRVRLAGAAAAPGAAAAAPPVDATPEEMERLRRALAEVDG